MLEIFVALAAGYLAGNKRAQQAVNRGVSALVSTLSKSGGDGDEPRDTPAVGGEAIAITTSEQQ